MLRQITNNQKYPNEIYGGRGGDGEPERREKRERGTW
jgi:hypothetical protein